MILGIILLLLISSEFLLLVEKDNRSNMSEETVLVSGVNCSKTRWVYRGIGLFVSVGWLTRFIVELLWPTLCSSWSTWKDESDVVVLISAAPFLVLGVVVVRSFYVPVPKANTNYGAENMSGSVGIMMIAMCIMSQFHIIELSICTFSLLAGGLAVLLLYSPSKDICVQHVVYTDFGLCLVGYLGYQRPVWPAYFFLAALFLLNTFLFQGVLRLDFPSEEDKSVSDLNV